MEHITHNNNNYKVVKKSKEEETYAEINRLHKKNEDFIILCDY